MDIRVLVIDDTPMLRGAITAALETHGEIHVVACESTGVDGIRRAAELRPHVALLDLAAPHAGALVVLEELRRCAPDTRVIIMSDSNVTSVFIRAMALGAAGWLSRRCAPSQLVHAVVTVHSGATAISPGIAEQLAVEHAGLVATGGGVLRPLLAQRQREVVRYVAAGLTDREIGERMYISQRTVQNHLARVREELGLHNRVEIANWAGTHEEA